MLRSFKNILNAAVFYCFSCIKNKHIVCGLALGWEDAQAPVNRTRTEREPLARYFSVLR